MWEHEDIINFIKLFGVFNLEFTHDLTKISMDSMTISDLNKIGITDDTVCLLIISQWKAECCGNDSPNAALKAVKHTIVCIPYLLLPITLMLLAENMECI